MLFPFKAYALIRRFCRLPVKPEFFLIQFNPLLFDKNTPPSKFAVKISVPFMAKAVTLAAFKLVSAQETNYVHNWLIKIRHHHFEYLHKYLFH